ncbi:DUF6879 family protein [Streptomyces iranensis]|uniref:DUF6879 domain-containing protein n=1 Tax=Streptomyces iranensis TaxID=576784 RepID=A0A060ZR09_9ACTN|nr:DUF6879 family protein [Streptomyces iranensis]MBP2063084.1 hypothetical protein [Streptomyces iranensis]CDR05821.1 predicted protein [Streptomyces iranensis]
MTLRFIAKDPNTNGDNCPTVWVDEKSKDLIIQGWKADSATEQECLETGNSPENRDEWWNDFHSTIAEAVERGVKVRRARVVSEPLSEYIRYEHSCTFQNILAGEEVRWLPRRLASDLLLPGNDLWLFDNDLIRFGLFSGEGAFVGHTLSVDPDVSKNVSEAFESIWSRALPHDRYSI